MEILDEISILSPKSVEEAYQSGLKVEEKLTEGRIRGEDVVPDEEGDSPMAEVEFLAAMMNAKVRK